MGVIKMGEYNRVYTMSNENIGSFRGIYNFDNASVLTVLGSEDQYFNSLLYGASDVTTFDVNYTAWLYFRIKYKAIKMLSYQEFIKVFVLRNMYDIEVYSKMAHVLDYEEIKYYVYLVNYFSDIIHSSQCFYPNVIITSRNNWKDRKEINPYLDEDNYYKLQDIINKIDMPRFIITNFMDMEIEDGYDILLLSNIYDYINRDMDKYMELVKGYRADTLVKYSWYLNDNDRKFIRMGMSLDRVKGLMKSDNYVLSLKR